MSDERPDHLALGGEQACDIIGGAVPEANPYNFRLRAQENAQTRKILIFGDDHQFVPFGIIPNLRVRRLDQARVAYVK